MVELNGVRIWAVAIRDGEAMPPRKLVCGTLAREVKGGRPAEAPALPGRLQVPGRPDVSVAWTGWFELATEGGELLAVYGAKVEPVG